MSNTNERKTSTDGIRVLSLFDGISCGRVALDRANIKVKEYNALSYLTGEEVTRLIYWLIGRHYIIKTTGQYPVLHITNEGLKYAELFTPRIAGNLRKWLETEADRRLLDEQDI